MRPRPGLGLLLTAWCGLLAGCGGASTATKHPESLETWMTTLRDAAIRGDAEHFRSDSMSMVPTVADLRRVLREGPDTETFLAKFKGTKEQMPAPSDTKSAAEPIPMSDEFKKRTEIHVYAATTEELARYEKGTLAFEQFPGGMRRFAQKVAAPGRTWYCVAFVEPGHESGTKFTCLTRLDDRFVIVAKPWRAMPRDPAPEAPAATGEDGK